MTPTWQVRSLTCPQAAGVEVIPRERIDRAGGIGRPSGRPFYLSGYQAFRQNPLPLISQGVLIESGKPLTEVAAELDVSPGQLSQWRNEQLAAGSAEALAQKRR
jgi:Transposase